MSADISAGWIIGGAVAGGVLGGAGFAALSHFGIISTASATTAATSGLCADGDCGNEANEVAEAVAYVTRTVAKPVASVVRTGSNTVYQVFQNGIVRYVGITNNIIRRAYEHFSQRGWSIQAIPGLENLNRFDARAVEQVLIEYHGLANLENVINSVSVNNPSYQELIKRGREILQTIQYLR